MTSRRNEFSPEKSLKFHSNFVTGNLQLIRQELRFEFVAFFSFKGQVQNKKDAKETFNWKVALNINKW